MPHTLRLATFNCENLFDRPKIFNEPLAKSRELLAAVDQLQDALRQPVFDQPAIAALKKKLKVTAVNPKYRFANIIDVRKKHDKVAGAADWLGWVELNHEPIADVAIGNTARVIADLDADIVCLVEVDERTALQRFHDDLLEPRFLAPAGRPPYPHVLLVDGNDPRGIDVAVLSRHPVLWLRSHIHETADYLGKTVKQFSRDCLEVRIGLPGNRWVHLFLNHLKSKKYSGPQDPTGALRREGQARRIAQLLLEYDLTQDFVVVAGDLNADPAEPDLAPLLSLPGLYNVNLERPASDRWTYKSGKKQFDYLLVSTALRGKLQQMRIERRGIYSSQFPHYPEVKDDRTAASDHAAVVAEFQWS